MTTTTLPPFPFATGQRVRHTVTGEIGTVQGWSVGGGSVPYYVMGVRCAYPLGDSAVQSTLDGWIAADAAAHPAALSAAEYMERTHDQLKQLELHPADHGRIDLDAFTLMSQDGRRRSWALADDADKRGLALQIIRRKGHGPDEETIGLYIAELDARFGPSPVERMVMSALEKLAEQEAAAARLARTAGESEDTRLFQRSANAYAKALGYYQRGIRPEPTPNGYTLPSQRAGEAPHLLTMDGDWVCTCPAGATAHWAKALVVGIETAFDGLGA